jgi:hypothetical protein
MTIKALAEYITAKSDPDNPGCVQEQIKRRVVRERVARRIEGVIREAYDKYELKGVEGDLKKVK